MLNTIIIEDEKAARQNLINALMNIDANLNVVAGTLQREREY